MRAIVAISFICISAFGMSPDVIYEIASQYTSEPETIVSMAFIESSHGINKVGDGGASLGLLQLQCRTVLWFAKKDKSLMWLRRIPRKSLKNLLLHYDKLNVEIASKMLQWRINRYGYKMAIIRHNGLWSINREGKAMYNKDGGRILNNNYYERVINEKDYDNAGEAKRIIAL